MDEAEALAKKRDVSCAVLGKLAELKDLANHAVMFANEVAATSAADLHTKIQAIASDLEKKPDALCHLAQLKHAAATIATRAIKYHVDNELSSHLNNIVALSQSRLTCTVAPKWDILKMKDLLSTMGLSGETQGESSVHMLVFRHRLCHSAQLWVTVFQAASLT